MANDSVSAPAAASLRTVLIISKTLQEHNAWTAENRSPTGPGWSSGPGVEFDSWPNATVRAMANAP